MRGKYLLEAAALYVVTIGVLYMRRKTVDNKKEMKARKWYTTRQTLKGDEAIAQYRSERIGAIDPEKYKLEDDFKESYRKKTYVR